MKLRQAAGGINRAKLVFVWITRSIPTQAKREACT